MNLYALVMVKNESAVIERTLDSVGKLIKGGCQIGGIYVYDTGSVDGTLDICKKWGCENEVDIRTARGPWVNFAVGRNTALEWIEKSVPSNSWILLLDANDELQCEPESLNRLNRVGLNVDGCYINQVWKLQPGMGTTKYKGLKLIRTGRNWFWKYPVHELLKKKIVNRGAPFYQTFRCFKIGILTIRRRWKEPAGTVPFFAPNTRPIPEILA